MLCKQVLALFLWCHCYQIVLDPLLHLLAVSLDSTNLLYSSTTATRILNQLQGNSYYNNHHHHRYQRHQDGQETKPIKTTNNNYYHHLPQQQERANDYYQRRRKQILQQLFVNGSPIEVEASRVALIPGHEMTLKCYIERFPNEQFTWHRVRQYSNRELLSDLSGSLNRNEEELKNIDGKYIISNNNIIIKSPTSNDVGDYYCRVKNPQGEMETEKMIAVRVKPFIYDFDIEASTPWSAVIEEGKSLKINCNVYDDYVPESNIKIGWNMSKYDENYMNDVISGEEGIRIEIYNATSQALIIDKVTKDHRRFYKCHVTNGITDNSKVILIRVRDKYTVLWPAVGIVIELVILIGVIVVVESRKVEPDKGAYDRKAIQM